MNNKVAIELRVVQFWSEIILVISNYFEITLTISDQISLHSVQLHYITYPMESARSDWLINTLAPFARGLHAHVCLACLFAIFLGWTKIGRQRFSLAVRFAFRLSERQFEAVCLSEIQETWNHRDPSKTLISRSLCQILEVLFPKRKRVFNRGI